MGKQVTGWKDAPLVDTPTNGQDTPKWQSAPLVEEVKKKDIESPASSNGTPELGLPDTSAPVQPEDVPSGERINELQKQLEQKRQENIDKVQAVVPKIDAGLTPLAPTKLGGEPKGIGELGADIIKKDFSTQKDSLAFLADQNKKLLGSIKEAGKITPIKADQTIVKPLIKVPESELAANELQFQDQEAAHIRQETKVKEEADTGLGRFSSAAGTFDQQIVSTFANILKSTAIGAANTIGRLGLSGQFGKATDPTQDWAYQLADWVESHAKEAFPENPAYQGEFLAKTVPEVAGTLFSFMLGGALGKTTRLADLTIPSASKAIMRQTAEHIPAAFMASASTAAGEYERSLQATGDPETAFRTWERDMFTGVPFLISPTFRAFDKATNGALKYGVKQFAQGGIAGGFQMATSHAIENLSAQETYDKTREITEGVLSTGGAGFGINGVLTGLLAAISHKAIGATPAEKAIYEQNIQDIQAQREYTKSLGNTDYYKEPVGGVESGFKGLEGHVATPSGDIGLKMPEIISEAKNEIKSSSDTPTIEAKAEEIIEAVKQTPVEGVVNDRTNIEGQVSSQEREGQEPVKAEPDQGTSEEKAPASGVFQTPEAQVTLSPEAKEGVNKPVSDEVIPAQEPVNQTTTINQTDEPGSLPSEQPTVTQDEATPTTGSNALPSEPPGEPSQTPPPTEGQEPPVPGPEQTGAGIKKALVPEEKVAQMENQLENRTNEEFLEQGKKDVESGEIDPVALVNDVVGNHRALQTHEVAALVYYKAKMDNRFDDINQRLMKIKQEGGDPGEAKYLNDQLKAITEERDRFHEMQLITAREQGRAFGLRKMMLDNEYNLLSQVNQYKAQSADGEIPPAVMEHFKVQDEIIRKANERIAALERAAEQRIGKKAEEAIRKTVKKERVPGVKRGKALIDEGLNELKGIKWDASTGIIFDPKREAGKQLEQDKKVIKALSKIGKGMIQEGLATVEDVAAKLKEYIQEKLKGLPFEKYQKDVVDNITASLPRPTVKEGKLKIPKSVIHDLVEDGIDTIEDLTTAIHNMVKAEYPGITERQVRDAITEYGKMANLSKDEIDTKVRELKRVGKRISILEDLKRKLRPLHSGLQRDKPTDKERAMDREIRDALKDLPEDVEETARVWKTAIEGTKTRLKNQITDLEEQIATGKKTPKKKGIVYDEEALALQAKRDELRDQLQAIEGKPELSDEQRLRMAVTAAEKSLKDYNRRIEEADFAAKERKVPVDSQELSEIKARRDAAKEQLNKVREELGVTDLDRLAKAKQAVKKSQENYERRIKEGEFTTKERPKIIADSELEKAMIARDKAKFEFDVAQEKNRLANRSGWEITKDVLAEAFDLPKSLISSFDISAVGRQGIILSVAHPSSARKAFVEMFKKMASKEYNEKWFHRLQQSDIYPQIKTSKLYIAEPHAKLTAREEGFVSKYTEKIPGIAISNRAYAGYLNALRVDVFSKGVDALKDVGYTEQNNPQAFKDWASFINNATGRGNLGKLGEAAAPLLNRLFFSPRLLKSRINLLNPFTYGKMDPKVREMAMGDMLKFISLGVTVLGVAAAAGAEVETDPRSTDFGKMKIGNTRYDIWGGFQSLVRTIAQIAPGIGQVKKASGEIVDLKLGIGKSTRADVIGKFLRGKESPTVSAAHNLLAGTNLAGEPATPQGEALRLMIPLYTQDIASLYQSEGIKGVAQGTIPALVGIGVQSYPSSGVEKDTPTAKISADHDYYFSAPGRYSATFATPPTAEQYKNFVTIRGEEIQKQFDEHKESLSKLDNEHYKKRMDHFVKRATNKALFQAGIPEKNHREVPVAEEVY